MGGRIVIDLIEVMATRNSLHGLADGARTTPEAVQISMTQTENSAGIVWTKSRKNGFC